MTYPMRDSSPQPTRRSILAGMAAPAFSPAAVRRPNILYVMTDDHAHARMSCAGDRFLSTPNLDRLAREGVRFDNCFCTNSLCAPSRATCLTGAYSHRNGVRGKLRSERRSARVHPARHPDVPGTAAQNRVPDRRHRQMHLNDEPRGFDYSYILPGQGLYEDPEFIENGVRKKAKGYVTDLTTDRALEWLEHAV